MSSSTSLPVSRTAGPDAVLRAVADALASGQPVVMATVVARNGSTPATPGQKLALLGPAAAMGTIGGGELEAAVLREMVGLLESSSSEPLLKDIALGPELGMACGGAVQILLEPLPVARAVLIVGAGHVGASLAPLLADSGFRVVMCDSRPAVVEALRGARSATYRLELGAHDSTQVEAALGGSIRCSAMVAMTHDHSLDEQALRWALERGFDFVGGVGSRRKAAKLRSSLATSGFDAQRVDALRMPLGLDIGARAPSEIAVAIAAELIAWRRGVQPPGALADAGKPTG